VNAIFVKLWVCSPKLRNKARIPILTASI
jgi:hypothetical protein